jgi:hypothetical protein
MTLREFTAKVGQRDGSITVAYETTCRNGSAQPGLFGDRWIRAPYRIAETALWTGTTTFEAHSFRRDFKVETTMDEAEEVLRELAELDFTLKRPLARALAQHHARETTTVTGRRTMHMLKTVAAL